MSDTELRITALGLANQIALGTSSAITHASVTDRAQAYFDFLSVHAPAPKGIDSTEAVPATSEPSEYHRGWNDALAAVIDLRNRYDVSVADQITVQQAMDAVRSLRKV